MCYLWRETRVRHTGGRGETAPVSPREPRCGSSVLRIARGCGNARHTHLLPFPTPLSASLSSHLPLHPFRSHPPSLATSSHPHPSSHSLRPLLARSIFSPFPVAVTLLLQSPPPSSLPSVLLPFASPAHQSFSDEFSDRVFGRKRMEGMLDKLSLHARKPEPRCHYGVLNVLPYQHCEPVTV